MGVSVQIGALANAIADGDPEEVEWLRDDLALVNNVLASYGLGPHEEPEALPNETSRCPIDGVPYQMMGQFREYAATAPWWCRWLARDPAREDDEIGLWLRLRSGPWSHLLCHSDSEGYYVPIRFRWVIHHEDVPGELLGSSFRLKAELERLAPRLGITLDKGMLSDAEAHRLATEIETSSEADGAPERAVWFTLFEATRLSIAHRSVITFG